MKRIKLTKGKYALVDDCDFEYLNQFKWCVNKSYTSDVYYVVRSKKIDGKWKQVRMHRLIMNAPKGMEVDHKDGDALNNQRCNLRVCTLTQNHLNRPSIKNCSSKYKGVSWLNMQQKWRVRISVNGKQRDIGCFNTELEAGIIANITIRRYHGEFARTNKLVKINQ